MLPYFAYKRLHPEVFQGRDKTRNYFEGWYLKHVSADGQTVFSLIPGIAYNKHGEGHSFIQLIDGQTAQTHYAKFSVADFEFDKFTFQGRIGNNHFGKKGVSVDLNPQGIDFKAELHYSDLHPLHGSFSRPGIMGWYGWIPVMECYHGLVSKFHHINGTVWWQGQEIAFTNGNGYIEKDWGRSFPSSWVWVQSNNFSAQEVSFMLSIANIPWLGAHFTGFLCSILLDDKIHVFATYTGARVTQKQLNGSELSISIENKTHRIKLNAHGAKSGILKAPTDGAMVREIAESIQGVISIRFETLAGKLIFEGTGTQAGIEIVGDVSSLLNGKFRNF